MGIYEELSTLDEKSPTPQKGKGPAKGKGEISKSTDKSVDKPVGQSTDQSTDESTSQTSDPLAEPESLGSIVERPRAFYITEKIDRWLDEGVRHLQDMGLHKMDRSVLINGLLHDPKIFKPINLDANRKRFMAHLTNKMLKRARPADS